VLDTNVLVRGLANRGSDSGRVLRLCEDRAVLVLLSRPVMREYRDVLTRNELTRGHPAITSEAVGLVIERLRYIAEIIHPIRARFRYDAIPMTRVFLSWRSPALQLILSAPIMICSRCQANAQTPASALDNGCRECRC
jgi:hypothetical protein